MNKTWTIAMREFRSFFDSLIAYIVIFLFLGFSGLFTWILGSDVFLTNQATMMPFFGIAIWTTFFFVPALTMRMLAEENKTGTIELLLTKAVSNWQVVLGKFLACIFLVVVALVLSLPFYFTIAWLGPVDHGAVWCGYLGIILMAAAYAGIGIFVSSFTNNQIVALLLSYLIGLVFIISAITGFSNGFFGNILHQLSIPNHYLSMARGVFDSRDILFFLSIAGVGLILAETILSRKNSTN